MTDIKETPYDDVVEEFMREEGWSLDQARDCVIWAGVQMGDTGPLICFLLRGYVPGLRVRQRLAMMLVDEQALPAKFKKDWRIRFEIKARDGKRGPRRVRL